MRTVFLDASVRASARVALAPEPPTLLVHDHVVLVVPTRRVGQIKGRGQTGRSPTDNDDLAFFSCAVSGGAPKRKRRGCDFEWLRIQGEPIDEATANLGIREMAFHQRHQIAFDEIR